MKKILIILALVILYSCNKGNGELIGVQGRQEWYQPDPFGMLFIPMGSYNMGPSDQNVPYALTAQSRTVSVQAFTLIKPRYLIMNTVSLFIMLETLSLERY